MRAGRWLGIAIVMLLPTTVFAGEIRVAVASNFAGAITAIAERFEKKSGHNVTLAFGSTGKHYAQIKHGAPFDAFLAADGKRPRLLRRTTRSAPQNWDRKCLHSGHF